MEQIVDIIGPTFFVIAVGYLFGRVARPDVATLIDAAMFITTPCLVFYSMYMNTVQLGEAARLWLSCLLVMAGSFVLAWLVFGLRKKGSAGIYLPVAFSNTINIPLPILYLAFGNEGVAKAILYYIPNGLLIYSIGVYVASGQHELRQGLRAVLRTPLIYAAVLGLVFNLSSVPVPRMVLQSLSLMGQAAVPLMLLVLGINVGRYRLTRLPTTLAASVIRVGGGLVLGLLAVWLLSLSGVPRAVVIFQAAMPSAIFNAILCTKYNNDAEMASSIVLATTVMAVGVIPALLYYLT